MDVDVDYPRVFKNDTRLFVHLRNKVVPFLWSVRFLYNPLEFQFLAFPDADKSSLICMRHPLTNFFIDVANRENKLINLRV